MQTVSLRRTALAKVGRDLSAVGSSSAQQDCLNEIIVILNTLPLLPSRPGYPGRHLSTAIENLDMQP